MNNRVQKTILCMHDLSLAGGVSLSAIIPLIAARGCGAVPMPSALFSAHTGFGEPCRLDTADFLLSSIEQFKTISISADTIYSGYIMNEAGAGAVRAARSAFPLALRIHDPAFADGGRIYSGITDGVIEAHRHLSADSGLILPNVTEALALCGRPPDSRMTAGKLAELSGRLLKDFAPSVITGVKIDGESFNAVVLPGELIRIPFRRVPGAYPGTGDAFGALIAADLTMGLPAARAVERASPVIEAAIAYTNSINSSKLFGIDISFAVREVIRIEDKAKFKA